jgi:sulfonate transport system substrate-binding protein
MENHSKATDSTQGEKTQLTRREFVRTATLGTFGLAAALSAGSLAGCSSEETHDTNASETDSASGEVDLSKVTLRWGDIYGWDYLKEQLEAAGVADTPYKLESTIFLGVNPAMEALAADQIDITQASSIPPLFASQTTNGGNFKVIANSDGYYSIKFDKVSTEIDQGVLASPGSGVTTIAELKGRKVGYVKNTTAHYFLAKLLDQNGLSWADITPTELPLEDGAAALLSNQVDAYAVYGMTYVAAKEGGGIEIAAADEILAPGGHFYGNIIATPDAITDPGKSAAILDFLVRLNTAQHYCAEEGLETWAEAAYEKLGYASKEEGIKLLARSKSSVIPIDPLAQAFEQDVADTLHEIGIFEQPIDVEEIYDHSLDSALAEALDSSHS